MCVCAEIPVKFRVPFCQINLQWRSMRKLLENQWNSQHDLKRDSPIAVDVLREESNFQVVSLLYVLTFPLII